MKTTNINQSETQLHNQPEIQQNHSDLSGHTSSQTDKLGTAPLGRLILSLALPTVMAQLVNVLYNIVDKIYIGHLKGVGADALTGLGITLPIVMIVSAFSSFAAAGGAPLASIALGKGDKEKAEKIEGNSAFLLLLFSMILTTFFLVFKTPILYAFGASNVTITYAREYISIYLTGTIFVETALGLNMFISCQGQARTAMFSVLIGAVCNIILDPILIFVFHLGIRGAAIATIISQAISALYVVLFLISSRTTIQLKLQNMKPDLSVIGPSLALGISPCIMQATESAITIVFNFGLKKYGGDLYVGSMTVLQSVLQLVFVPISGFTQGVQPIISYNYGARNTQRVKKTFQIMLTLSLAISFIFCTSAIVEPGFFAKLFTNDTELIQLICKVLPIYLFGMTIFGIQNACQATFMGLGQAKISLFIALFRKVIVLIPLALALPHFFGVYGIYYAEPIADILSVTVAFTLFLTNIKRILSTAP